MVAVLIVIPQTAAQIDHQRLVDLLHLGQYHHSRFVEQCIVSSYISFESVECTGKHDIGSCLLWSKNLVEGTIVTG